MKCLLVSRSCRNISSRKVSPVLLVASANFPLGSEMLRQFRGKRNDAKFFSHCRKNHRTKMENSAYCYWKVRFRGRDARRDRYTTCFREFARKQIMTGISSLLPQRAQRLRAHSVAPLSIPPFHVTFVPGVENVAWNGLMFESCLLCNFLQYDLYFFYSLKLNIKQVHNFETIIWIVIERVRRKIFFSREQRDYYLHLLCL